MHLLCLFHLKDFKLKGILSLTGSIDSSESVRMMRLVKQEKLETKKMLCVEVRKEEEPKVRYAALL